MRDIMVEVGGETYSGRYELTGRPGRQVIRVTSAFGGKATQLGGSPPESMARMLLRELVQERADR